MTLSLFLLAVTSYATGYYLDPAVLGFLFTPILTISLVLVSLFFTILPIIRLTRAENRNIGTMKAITACLIVWLLVLALPIPGSNEGAAFRLSNFSEKDYREISSIVAATYKLYGNNAKYFSRGSKDYSTFIGKLKTSHEIFRLSEFPLDVSINDTYTMIEWASGLTGGYELVILNKSGKLPYWLAEREVHYLYETVAFYYIS